MSKHKRTRDYGQVEAPMPLSELATLGYGLARSPESSATEMAVTPREIQVGRVRFTATAMIAPPDLQIEEWETIGAVLGKIDQSISWWIGDFCNSAESRWGDTFTHAAQLTGLKSKTLRNIASVCDRFHLSRRRDNLSFAHHATVAYLPIGDQDLWLDRAVREGMSATRLRNAVAGGSPDESRRIRRTFSGIVQALRKGRRIREDQLTALEQWIASLRAEGWVSDEHEV